MSGQTTMLMAIDVGTSFIKTFVYDLSGVCVANAIAPVNDERPSAGIFLQRGDEIFDSVVSAMKSICQSLGEKAGNIEAIIFSGQMAGFMGVDGEWNDITTWSCSLDTRYVPYADKQISAYGKTFTNLSGTGVPQMAPKFEWFKNEFPDLDKKICKYLMISGYVLGRLGTLDANDAVMDITFSTWTGLADIGKREWSEEICNMIGLDRNRLPRIVDSNCICSHLSKEMAEHIGLKAGVPLVSGAGDKIASCIGSAIVEPGDVNFEASSYGAIHVCVSDFRPDESYDCIPSPIPGEFYLTKYLAGSGITIDWFMNTFYCDNEEKLSDAFKRIERQISDIPPGSDGLMGIGLLAGNAFPLDGTTRGMWLGFDWSHRQEHFYKAFLESYAYEFAITFDKVKEKYPELKFKPVYALGGGAKSYEWMQINADVTGMEYKAINRDDTAAWGAAILAGNAIGAFPDIREKAKSSIKTIRDYDPVEERHAKYKDYKELYIEFLHYMKHGFNKLEALKSKYNQ